MNRSITVVKVGGSLFDIPRLGARLDQWLARLEAVPLLLVPGGGPTADLIRACDRHHQLGAEKSHWLALRVMTLNAHVLADILPGGIVINDWHACRAGTCRGRLPVLDCYPFAAADEGQPGCLPHSWNVTSDSIAARVAAIVEARELVLLKSVDIPDGCSCDEAGRKGWVDPYFARVIPADLPIRTVNFRRWCQSDLVW